MDVETEKRVEASEGDLMNCPFEDAPREEVRFISPRLEWVRLVLPLRIERALALLLDSRM